MRAICAALLLALAAAAAERELARDGGKQDGKRSSAGTGHVVSFDAPRGTWWIRAVAVHGARYGGGYDPATTTFTVTVCDARGKALARTDAAYALFAPGSFAWVEVPLAEPVEAPREFSVIVEFAPTRTKGVYVGFSETGKSHSGHGVPGGDVRPFDGEWMIRARLSSSKPEGVRAPEPEAHPQAYRRDFDFLARTVRTRFPALAKKGVDWRETCREWRPRFLECPDDRTHLLNVYRLLAVLGDMHTGVADAKVEVHVPSFDGLYGAGLWIAADRGRLVLRATTDGHPLAERLRPGAELLRIDGKPAKLVHAAVRSRLREWHGWSSDHFLDARLSFQFFPFGEKERITATFLDADGAVVDAELDRWGPGGRGLSRVHATMPEGVVPAGLAVAARLDGGIGYVRILGGMNDATQAAFFHALDTLKGVDGVLLDCRGMGGGGDGPAWAMAGRFFGKRTRQGSGAPALEPTGDWQFGGPVLLLQDERMVSSAETFTWAMTETGRALSLGRPTGGATIIPQTFDAPSGLFRLRLGVHDRKTPIRGVQPEGVGTPPDVPIPCEPALLQQYGDPELGIARELLARWLATGERPAPPDLAAAHAAAFAEWELVVTGAEANPMPDFAGARARLEAMPLEGELAKRAAEAVAAWAREAEAQRAAEALLGKGLPSREEAEAFARRWDGTRYARTFLEAAR